MRGLVPLEDEFLRVFRGAEQRPQFCESLVIETKITGGKTFFQDRRPGLQCHRSPFHLVRRDEKNFSVTLEKGARDPTRNVLRKPDYAVLQCDRKSRSVNRDITSVIDA